MNSVVNGIFQGIILRPIVLIMHYLGKVLTSLLRLDFSYLFSSKGIQGFLLIFLFVLIILMFSLYGIGLIKVKNNQQETQQQMTKQDLTKRLSLALIGIFITPMVLIGIFALGAILKGFTSLLGYKEITFVSSLYTFANIDSSSEFYTFLQNNNIHIENFDASSGAVPLIVNPTGIGAVLKETSFGTGSTYLEINQDVVNALISSSGQGMGYINYNYILIPIFISVSMLFVLLPLIVSVISRLFTMMINYVLLYVVLAINILKPNSYQNQIQKIFADVVILTTYAILFYLVLIIQNTIVQSIITSNVVNTLGSIGLNLLIGLIIFTGTTVASLWPTWIAQTLFKDDQLLSQITNTNRNLWSRSSNAFKTAGMITGLFAGSFGKLFKGGNKAMSGDKGK